MKAAKICSLCLIGWIISGCSSTGSQIASFEDLTTEASKEGFTKLPQYRVISIPGFLPFSEVGAVHFYKPQRKPSSAIGISSGQQSYALQTTIGLDEAVEDKTHCDTTCLTGIRDKILQLKDAAARLVETRVNLTKLIAAPATGGADLVSTANANYQTARQALDLAHREAVQAIQDQGVMVFRWNTNIHRQGNLGLGTLFTVSGSRDETQSGFGLLSGLRSTTLYIGSDLVDSWDRIDPDSTFTNRLEMTTYSLQARHILYMSESDLSLSLGTKLQASYDQLADLSDTFKKLDQIEINAALAKVSNLGNIGVIGGAKTRRIPINWHKTNQSEERVQQANWQTIYAVKSDLSDMLTMMKQLKEPAVEP